MNWYDLSFMEFYQNHPRVTLDVIENAYCQH